MLLESQPVVTFLMIVAIAELWLRRPLFAALKRLVARRTGPV